MAGGSSASVEDFGRGIGVLSDGTTVIAAEFRANLVRPLFARRLALLARYPASALTSIEQGAITSAESIEHSGVDPCFATISITSDQANLNQPLGSGTLMDSTRELVIAFPFIHQLTGYGVTPGSLEAAMNRAYMLDEVAAGDGAGLGIALVS